MKLLRQIKRYLVVGATIGLLLPQSTFAGDRIGHSPIRDIALQQGGTLRGEVLSSQGQSASGQTISFATNGEPGVNAVVGADGKFTVSGLRPGVYSVSVGKTQCVIRLWSEVAAPPSATPELLLVDEQSRVVRGAHGGHLPQWDHPFLVGGLLVAAGVIGGVIGYNLKDAS